MIIDISEDEKELDIAELCLYEICRRGWIEKLEAAIADGANIHAANYRGYTPLHAIATAEQAQILIDAGADVNAQGGDHGTKSTPLHTAENVGIAKTLINAGADIHVLNRSHNTPLHLAKTAAISQLLIDKGADVNAKNLLGITPLYYAITAEQVRLLVDNGADLLVKTKKNRTALHFAAKSPFTGEDAVLALIMAGIDVNAVDTDQQTALHLVRTEEKAIALISSGADVNAIDRFGRTVIFYVKFDRSALIRMGADVFIRDLDYRNIIDYSNNRINTDELNAAIYFTKYGKK